MLEDLGLKFIIVNDEITRINNIILNQINNNNNNMNTN